jgi:hypothetical protein
VEPRIFERWRLESPVCSTPVHSGSLYVPYPPRAQLKPIKTNCAQYRLSTVVAPGGGYGLSALARPAISIIDGSAPNLANIS